MGRLKVCVTFAVEEVYGYEVEDGEDAHQREDELIAEAKDELLADFGLSEWQGEWYNSLVNYDEVDDD